MDRAKELLDQNWTGNFTIPSPVLYPHQWSWDSAFVAIDNSYLCIERAIKELEHLFGGQWRNGMLPHIIFNKNSKQEEEDDTYFPRGDFYNTAVSENAPKGVRTSGMTQPPVHAIACYYVYKNAGEDDRSKAAEFLKRIYPKLIKYHNYLLTNRDPEKSGLVTIFHPWESGLDNLPVWDYPLSRIRLEEKYLPKYKRLYIKAIDGARETREDDETYAKFIYLANLMKEKYNYDEQRIYQDFPFRVKDVIMSSILYVANKYLLEIAHILNQDADQIKQWLSRTEKNFFRYFTPTQKPETLEEDDIYNYDLVKKDWLRKRTIESLVPIYTGIISKENIKALARWINHAHYCGMGDCHVPVLPSTDLDEAYFKPKNYWRDPIWINMNWMIYYGLLLYGYHERAEQITQGIFKLVHDSGFREYYNPFNGEGLGGYNFSWSAALVIDLVNRAEKEDCP